MSDGQSSRSLAALTLVIAGAVASACVTVPSYEDETFEDDPKQEQANTEGKDEGKVVVLGDPERGPDLEQPKSEQCTSDCTTEGQKRCSTTSLSGTEVCTKGSDGCRKWTPGADCAENYSCNKTKNDGSCVAGCTSDPGCSATNAGVAHCTSDGTTELTCTKVGACFVFKTTRSNVTQACTSTYCGASSGRRLSCVASAAGACTQHVAVYDDCPTGTACTGAGVCTTTTTATGGCYSSTLGKTMPEGSCVLSAGDGVKEQCHNGLWYRGVSGSTGPYGACK